jgi:hypothetical protein
MPSPPPPVSQTLSQSFEPSPPQQAGDVAVFAGQKRSPTSAAEKDGVANLSHDEPPVHLKTRIIDPISSLLSDPLTDNPALTVLQIAAQLVVSFAERDRKSLSIGDWVTICERLAQAVSLSLTALDFGDDDEQSRAVRHVRKAFKPCSITEDMDIELSTSSATEPAPPMTSPNDSLLSSLRQMQASFESRLEARFNSRLAQFERRINNKTPQKSTDTPASSQTSSTANTPPKSSSPGQSNSSTHTSYAQAAAKARPAEPVRYVVRYQGHPPSLTSRMHPKAISDTINARLNNIPTAQGLQVLGSYYNTSGNIILTFPPHTSITRIEDHMLTIREVLDISSEMPVSRDVPWSKVVLGGVIARVAQREEVFSEEILLEVLLRNPQIKHLKITQTPRWVRRPQEISGFKSSVSFAFEDPDGSIHSALLKSKTPIFMFGAPVSIKRWVDKPRLRQCRRCWRLGHIVPGCKSPVHCRICGDNHSEESHRDKCKDCRKENCTKDRSCDHDPHCINCRQAHPADDANCPERKKFSAPATVPLNPTTSELADMITDS